MKRPFLALALAGASLALVSGCGQPSFHPTTTAPPGAVAELYENTETHGRSVRLTEGVAMAIECTDKDGKPCALDGSTVDDESIASYRKAYGDMEQKLVYSGASNKSYQNRALFVVVGKKVGKTRLVVKTGKGDAELEVDVRPR